jgi:hypothetical protein
MMNKNYRAWVKKVHQQNKDDPKSAEAIIEAEKSKHWITVLEDLEIDQENRKVMYPAKYLNQFHYVFMLKFYPVE